jgi:hypothetical protein
MTKLKKMKINICDVATFVLSLLNAKETNELALVHSEIFYGPPTSFVSRSTHNRVQKRKRTNALINFIEHLKIFNPNLHLLEESLQETDLNAFTLEWRAPFVRATTNPPFLDLIFTCPNLRSISIREPNKEADYCLPFFEMIDSFPQRLKKLDISEVHFGNDFDIEKILQLSSNIETIFCDCIYSRIIRKEKKWSFKPCSVFVTEDMP